MREPGSSPRRVSLKWSFTRCGRGGQHKPRHKCKPSQPCDDDGFARSDMHMYPIQFAAFAHPSTLYKIDPPKRSILILLYVALTTNKQQTSPNSGNQGLRIRQRYLPTPP